MTQHPALAPGRVAVITGAASGIGLAAAKRMAGFGMKVVMADWHADALAIAGAEVARAALGGAQDVVIMPTDVAKLEAVQQLRQRALDAFGEVAVLMNNAGVGHGGGPWERYDDWRRVIEINLWGVINGVQTFSELMIGQGRPAVIINTGSKQGITCPPGDTAYNVSKAGVKVLTEGLAHALRNTPDCQVSAHLLIPGFTYTGLTDPSVLSKPPGAWSADQVVDMLLEEMAKGTFYILCPDNDVSRALDNKRIQWAAEDIVQNRPPLSRWHKDFQAAFTAFVAAGDKKN